MSHVPMLTIRLVLLACLSSLTVAGARAATIIVPDDFTTIQAAIGAADTDDTVLVRAGTYEENIDLLGKRIALISESGPAATIIDGSTPADPDLGSTVTIPASADLVGVLVEGFTITGGTGTLLPGNVRAGGGLLVRGAATIRGNWIWNNHIDPSGPVSAHGGALDIDTTGGREVLVLENRIFSNSAPGDGGRGGGIHAGGSSTSPLIEDNQIFENESGSSGGGIRFNGPAGIVRHNVIACNQAVAGGGVVLGQVVENNTFVLNEAAVSGAGLAGVGTASHNAFTFNLGPGIDCSSEPAGSCNNFFGNAAGDALCMGGTNISMDPLYGDDDGCDAPYCLAPGSPMLPENSPPECGLIGARGLCATTAVQDVNAPTSADYASGPLVAYPNPFNPATTISFRLDRPSVVELDIVSARGRLVATLHRGFLAEGEHEMRWDGSDEHGDAIASGAYIAVLRSPAARYSQKLLLVK